MSVIVIFLHSVVNRSVVRAADRWFASAHERSMDRLFGPADVDVTMTVVVRHVWSM